MGKLKTLQKIVGAVGLIYAGYVVLTSLTDVGRYIKISTM